RSIPKPPPEPFPIPAPDPDPKPEPEPEPEPEPKPKPIPTPAPTPPGRLRGRSKTPPRIVGLKVTIGRRGTQTLVLRVNQAIVARSARATSSYLLRGAGADGLLDTADDSAVL